MRPTPKPVPSPQEELAQNIQDLGHTIGLLARGTLEQWADLWWSARLNLPHGVGIGEYIDDPADQPSWKEGFTPAEQKKLLTVWTNYRFFMQCKARRMEHQSAVNRQNISNRWNAKQNGGR